MIADTSVLGRPLNWAIIGYGWVARDFAAPAIAAAGHRVHAILDNSPAAQMAARAQGITAHETMSALLSDRAIDIVYVATPNHRHREGAEAALEAGIPVLCEKPMAATLADAEAVAAIAARTGTFYGTAFDQRHHPAHAAMRDLLRHGRLGTVTAIRICYACWLGPDWSATGDASNWRTDPVAAGGGALMDLAPHGLDLAQFLLGEPVDIVTALTQNRVHRYSVDDGAMILGRTCSGVLLSLHVAYNHPEMLPRRRLEVVGTGGMLVADNTMGQEPGGSLVMHDVLTGVATPVPIRDAGEAPFTRQMRAFAAAVQGGDRDDFDAQRDVQTMRLLEGAYGQNAILSGQPTCR